MKKDWTTRKSLIMRVKNQDDEQAWDEFVDFYKTFINVVLKCLSVAHNDMEDLTQDILVKIWKSIAKMSYDSEKANFRTWMNRVIRNAVIDFHRAKNRNIKTENQGQEIDTEDFPFDNNEFNSIIDREWQAHITNLALDNIRPRFSGNALTVFEMHLDGTSIKNIAKKLNIAESSVYKLRSRVEEKLIKEIKLLKSEVEFF